jgi:hypothetical protein
MSVIMLFGTGELGSRVLPYAFSNPNVTRVIVVDREPESRRPAVNTARFVAQQLRGESPAFESVYGELRDEARIAELIAHHEPTVIFTAASALPLVARQAESARVAAVLDAAGAGPWLPVELSRLYHLMRAVSLSTRDPIVINTSLPGITHPVLDRVGLSPTLGVGALPDIIPPLTIAAAEALGRPTWEVTVRAVMSDWVVGRLNAFGETGEAPYHLGIRATDREVTHEFSHRDLFKRLPGDLVALRGYAGYQLTTASAGRILNATLNGTSELLHGSGVGGLPGGYPFHLHHGRPALDLGRGISQEQAVKINTDGLSRDGIAFIDKDGSVDFDADHADVLAEALGYHCRRLPLTEVDDRAHELMAKYAEFVARERVEA